MFNFPKVSMIRFPKLIIHSILLTIVLTFILLFAGDIVGWFLGRLVENNTGYATFFVLIWAFFALQSEKYRKQGNAGS
ncbi:hypothetical protein SAMN04488072_11961 [Lentibacillus halodurans]|uniref:Uncharacterized protein n=1 Tax=Lentibacillus halodurans TaxID=237679 RepID=A0A1I1AER1_9BACI|nr:hypothetical protein [Lentibacillus halodurans]SFB36499.1 hypothetical protein SAMN04488072_11961 [Lentibacillus halodurans]